MSILEGGLQVSRVTDGAHTGYRRMKGQLRLDDLEDKNTWSSVKRYFVTHVASACKR